MEEKNGVPPVPNFYNLWKNEKWAAVGAVIYENKSCGILGEKTTG